MLQRLRAVRQNVRQNQDGFTLVELLIVIVILGVLAGIVVFAVNGITDRGIKSACKADVSTVQVASEAYFAQNGVWAGGIGAIGDTAASHTLIGAGLLSKVPPTNNYTITYYPDNTVAGHPAGSVGGVVNGGADCTT